MNAPHFQRDKTTLLRKGARSQSSDTITPDEEIKDPYVLEFLGLNDEYSETEIEAALTKPRAPALVPLACFLGDASSGLVRLMPPVEDMATGLWLLTHPDLRGLPRVRAVTETIAYYVTEHRSAIEALAEDRQAPSTAVNTTSIATSA